MDIASPRGRPVDRQIQAVIPNRFSYDGPARDPPNWGNSTGIAKMLGKLLQPELEEMIREGHYAELREIFEDMSPPDIAETICELPEHEMAVFFRILPRALAADVFENLPLEDQEGLLKALGQEQVAAILNELDPDDRTALLEELPGEVTRRLLTLLSPEELEMAKKLLGYPEESIGRRMTPDYLAVDPKWDMQQALDYIRRHGHDRETINVLYVVDAKGRLLDDIRLRDVILAPIDKKIEDLMDEQMVALCATDDQETAVAAFRKYDRVALPVTDTNGILVGIVTIDDVLDVAEEEATEDIHKLGGVSALDTSYLSTDLGTMIRKRAFWLVILFIGEMVTIWAMGRFEGVLEVVPVVALFVPLIISSGGNSGSQAASLVIRAVALGEVTLSDWWSIVRREVMTSLALGSILGSMGFLIAAVTASFKPETSVYWPQIGATLGFAVVGVVMWGTLVGSLMPLVMKRIGADPAASSAPLVATLVDVTGIIIYFSVAVLILTGTLL